MHQKTVILIAGPTAVGKSDMACYIADAWQTEIISADSRQCFKEMSIGTAVPSQEQLQLVQHHFIQSHSIHEDMSAGIFERYALNTLDKIFQKHEVCVICGGTGLYIKALLEGMDDMPPINEEIEAQINANYAERGIDYLRQELAKNDLLYAQEGNMQNPARMLRALIFYLSNGTSILSYRNNTKKSRDFKVIKIGLELDRAELYDRINKRVDVMMENGLLDEVERLYPFRHEKNLLTVGYQEFYQWGHWPLTDIEIAQSVEKIKQNSRKYAKRQMTWFKNQDNLNWYSPTAFEAVQSFIQDNL